VTPGNLRTYAKTQYEAIVVDEETWDRVTSMPPPTEHGP